MISKILCATVIGLVFMTNYSFASDGRKEMRSPTVQSAATGIPTQPVVANKDAVQSAIAANPAPRSPDAGRARDRGEGTTVASPITLAQAPTTQTPTPQTPPQAPQNTPSPQAPQNTSSPQTSMLPQVPPPAIPVDRQNVSAAFQAYENVRIEFSGWNNGLMAECDGWIKSLDMVQNKIMGPGPIDVQTYDILNDTYTRVLTEYNARVVTAKQEVTTYKQRYSAAATTWFNAIRQLPPAEQGIWDQLYSKEYDRRETLGRPGHQSLVRVIGFLEVTYFRLRGLWRQFGDGRLGIANG